MIGVKDVMYNLSDLPLRLGGCRNGIASRHVKLHIVGLLNYVYGVRGYYQTTYAKQVVQRLQISF